MSPIVVSGGDQGLRHLVCFEQKSEALAVGRQILGIPAKDGAEEHVHRVAAHGRTTGRHLDRVGSRCGCRLVAREKRHVIRGHGAGDHVLLAEIALAEVHGRLPDLREIVSVAQQARRPGQGGGVGGRLQLAAFVLEEAVIHGQGGQGGQDDHHQG